MPENNSSRSKIPRWLRRFIFAILFLIAITIFKGTIYRACVRYELVRQKITIDFSIHRPPSKEEKELPEIIDQTLDETTRLLSFTTAHCSTNASDLENGGKTNCIGYANLYARFCNDELSKNGLRTFYKSESYVAKIYLFGYNIHKFFSSPFWKDHDIVVITEKSTGKKILVDPTLYDYSGIGIVKERQTANNR